MAAVPVISIKEKLSPAYVAGLLEGDGSLVTPKPRQPGAKLRYSTVKISFALKDLPLANQLVAMFGGSVYNTTGKWVVFTIQNPSQVHAFISYINGYMRTPKIDALH